MACSKYSADQYVSYSYDKNFFIQKQSKVKP